MNNQPKFNQDDLDAFLDQQMKLTQWEEPSNEQVEKLEQFWYSLSDDHLTYVKWEEATDEQLKRLEQFWYSLSDEPIIAQAAQEKQKWLNTASQLTICFTIVVSFVFLIWNSQKKSKIVTDNHNPSNNMIHVSPSVNENDNHDPRLVKKNIAEVKKDVAAEKTGQYEMKKFTASVTKRTYSRPPTAYELFLLQSRHINHIHRPQKHSFEEMKLEYKNTLSKMFKTIEQMAGFVRFSQYQLESYLLEQIPLMNVKGQNELIRMLAVVGQERSVSSLAGFMNHSLIRNESFQSLLEIATSQDLSRMVPYLRMKSERMMVYQELLIRSDDASLKIFFEYVKNKVVRNEALDVLSRVDHLNYDFFFRIMDHPGSSDQIMAALVLGRSDNTEVISRLLEKVSKQSHRRAAVIALLVSNHEGAIRFINSAARYPVLLAEIQSVKTQLSTNVY